MKKLSIIIPVYNTENYVKECLTSIVNQTISNDIEAIVVNDGSTDKSQEILNEFAGKYPDIIKVYEKENGGLSSARNFALEKVNAEYITFLDSDDYVVEDAYEKGMNAIEKENLDILFFDFKWSFPDGKLEHRNIIPNFVHNESIEVKYLFSDPTACNKIIKRNILEGIKFVKGIWYEDLATIPGLINRTNNIGYLNEGLYIYRQRENSITSKNKYNPKLLDIVKACDSMYNDLIKTEYKDELEYLCIFQLIYYASFRFMEFDKYEQMERCISHLKDIFPNWKENKYYKIKPILFKVYCNLLVKKQYGLAKILIKLRGKN